MTGRSSGLSSIPEYLADAASTVLREGLAPEAGQMARHCLLDWLGCALAGTALAEVTTLRRILFGEAEPLGARGLVAAERCRSPFDAALYNGVAGHALDFDDNHFLSETHPGAAIWPAILAAPGVAARPLPEILRAFAAGVEALGALGAAMNPEHYARAWHATGTLGTVGAALAVSALRGVPRERMAAAAAFAAVNMSGMQASFGSVAKPLNAGRAAAAGLLAARMAEDGLGPPAGSFEGRGGVFPLMGGEAPMSAVGSGRAQVLDIVLKRYPSCFSTHAAIDAALALRRAADVDPGQMRAVRIGLSHYARDQVAIPRPRSATEARFSVSFCVATALAAGRVGVDDVACPEGAPPAVRSLLDATSLSAIDGFANFEALVEVERRDGTVWTHRAVIDPSEPAAMTDEDVRAKYRQLACPVIGDGPAARLEQLVLEAGDARVGDVVGLVSAD